MTHPCGSTWRLRKDCTTDRRKKTARPVVMMVNGEHDHGLLDLIRRADRRSMVFSFPFAAVGSIVTPGLLTTVVGSAGDDLFQVAELLARGLVSTLDNLLIPRSSRVAASSRESFGDSNCLISLVCTASVVKGSPARSSMGEPDGLLSIEINPDTPHPTTRTSDV
jgi:hypothetical protein